MTAPRSRKSCDLYFDDTGERLIHARGVLPPDMDLADGWGKSLHGLRCGLGVSTKEGTLDEVKVAVTIRNDGEEDGRLPLGSLYFKPRLIGKNGAVFKAGDIKHAKLNAHALKKPFPKQSVDSGEVETRDSPRPLSDWFSEIPPGEYQLLVVHPDPDGDMSLVSNRVTIMVTK